MSTQKLSLSSPVFAGRIKKYDTYKSTVIRDRIAASKKPGLVFVDNLPKNQTISKTTIHKIKPLSFNIPNNVKPKVNNQKTKSDFKTQFAINSDKHKISQTRNLALHAVSKSNFTSNYSDGGINNLANTIYTGVKSKTSRFQKFIYAFGVTVLILSAGISIQTFLTNNEAKQQIATLGDNVTVDEQGVAEGSASEPSESSVSSSAIASYQTNDPTHPRYLRIPALGIFSRVKNLGTTNEGAVDAPKNINDVGWYNGSAKPGAKAGASLLLGHVSGWTAPGIFKNVGKLAVGDSIEIERGNGEKISYEVTQLQEYPLASIDMGKILSTEVAGQNDLKLMTCSGKYNTQTREYDHRMVVYAKRV